MKQVSASCAISLTAAPPERAQNARGVSSPDQGVGWISWSLAHSDRKAVMEELLQTLTVSLRIYVQNYRCLMILFLAILYSTLILPLFSFLMLCEDILSMSLCPRQFCLLLLLLFLLLLLLRLLLILLLLLDLSSTADIYIIYIIIWTCENTKSHIKGSKERY